MTVTMVRPAKRPRRILQPGDVYDIRVRALGGLSHRRLAAEFGVAQSTVTRAVGGDTFAHVPFPVVDWRTDQFVGYEDAVAMLVETAPEDIEVMVAPPSHRFTTTRMLRILDTIDPAVWDEATPDQRRALEDVAASLAEKGVDVRTPAAEDIGTVSG